MRKIKSDTERILARIRDLRPGEHLCAIHDNKSQQLAAAAAFIRGGSNAASVFMLQMPTGQILFLRLCAHTA